MKIQFYINEFLTQNLEAKMIEGESPHLAAKRLLEGILNGESPPQTSQVDADVLTELQSRLEKLETQEVTPLAPDALEEIRDRLIDLGDRLTELEKHRNDQQETRDFLEKTMNEKRFDLLEQYGDRLTELENGIGMSADDLDRLVQIVRERILDESLKSFGDHLDALEVVSTKKPENQSGKGMTHTALAEKLGLDRSTVTRWRNDRSKWPEGFLWSDEYKKWFTIE